MKNAALVRRPQVSAALRWPLWGLVSIAALCAGCGPTAREGGLAVSVMSPLLLLEGVLLITPLAWLSRRREPALAPDVRRLWWLGAATVLLSLVAYLRGRDQLPSDLFVASLYLAGASFSSIALLVWRIAAQLAPARAFVVAPAIASIVIFVPALERSFSSAPKMGYAEALWMLPGYFGITTGVFFVGLLIEALVRGRRSTP